LAVHFRGRHAIRFQPWGTSMDAFLADVRYAIRRLRGSPGFSTVVILTLALGIGANTAIFSVVNAVLLRPLPYPSPDELVSINHLYPSLNGLKAPVSTRGFADYRDLTRSFSSVAIESGWGPNLTERGEPERLDAARVSALWFKTFGVAPLVGRHLLPDEDQPGRNKVVVLSHELWQRLFNGDRRAVGQTLVLNGEAWEIVGVMPAGFRGFFSRTAQLWTPLALPPSDYTTETGRTNEWLNLTGRLKPGVTVDAAQRELTALAARSVRDFPNQYPRDWTLLVRTLSEIGSGSLRPVLFVLLGAVGFVLLIACANVANLLLARASARVKEVAIRAALGAKGRQLVRQLLTESMVLAVIGGGVGLLLAFWGVKGLAALQPANAPIVENISIDATVLGFTIVLTLVTGILFGLVPALQLTRTNLQTTLKEGGRGAQAERSGQLLRRTLVVAEVALALTLLTGAGLLIRSFARVAGVDPGFKPSNLLTFNVVLPRLQYPSDTQQVAFYDAMLRSIASTPGVSSVGVTSVMPFGGSWSTGSFNVEGYTPPEGQPRPWGDIRIVSADFLKTLGMTLVKGRMFDERDRAGAPRVVMVDQEMVKRYWPNTDPIGKRISRGNPADTATQWLEVVGVVSHAAHEGLDADARVQLYYPYPQLARANLNFMSVAVRTTGDPLEATAAVTRAVHAVDKNMPLAQIRSMDQLIDDSVGQRRLSMILLGLFSAIALTLASIGIYGVMSYSVAQRARELGVRMALGAAREHVLRLVMRQGMTLVIAGIVIGLVGAFALTRLMTTLLFGVTPTDPLTFTFVALLLGAIAAIATLVPALRATRVDPVVAIRGE
jgi:putative ABC transport system permease protein